MVTSAPAVVNPTKPILRVDVIRLAVPRHSWVELQGRDQVLSEYERSSEFSVFVADVEPRLRLALCANFGEDLGREATADAPAFAWEHWDRIANTVNPAGYVWGRPQPGSEAYATPASGAPRRTAAPDCLDRTPGSLSLWREPECVHGDNRPGSGIALRWNLIRVWLQFCELRGSPNPRRSDRSAICRRLPAAT